MRIMGDASRYYAAMAEHRVTYRRGPDGKWVASVAGKRRCTGRGKTLRLARKEVRACLALYVEETDRIDLVEDVRLPPPARQHIVQHWKARRRAQKEAQRAAAATRAALESLLDIEVGLKDASDLLGIPPAKLQALRARKNR
jgi:predicted RNase H-like HicB family nuclease